MKILLIEDEPEVAEYLGMFLRDAGYTLETARDGEDARRHLARNPYDLILLDLILPDITGLELLQYLRVSVPNVPVMIVSGLPFDDERLLECLKGGAVGYVPKSLRAEELLTSVRRALRE